MHGHRRRVCRTSDLSSSRPGWYRGRVIVKLPFGCETAALDLRGLRVHALRPAPPRVRESAAELVAEALNHPLDTEPLIELARSCRTATVIVPDATRRAVLPDVLPVVLSRLRRAGIEMSSITVLVACGTHPAAGRKSLEEHLGPVARDLKVVEHDSRDARRLVAVGDLRPGIPLRLNRSAVECDLLVTVGTVRHHYFAGFGGGPKMIFPGVGGFEEIQANHALVLRRERGVAVPERNCEPGVLAGNPVAEGDFHYGFEKQAFLDAVARSKEYILAGDIFQVVLSQRMSVPFQARPIDVYRALRVLNPSPYMYFIDLGDTQIVGSSPEVLVRVEDRRMTVRPIAGTRPRGASAEADRAFARELL